MHDRFAIGMGNMFGIDRQIPGPGSKDIRLNGRMDEAMGDANEVIDRFGGENGWLSQFKDSIGIDSDVQRERDPLQLLAYAVDVRVDTRKRYEALRKFCLMETALHAAQDFREADEFMDKFLQEYIGLNLQGEEDGIKVPIRVISDHSPLNYDTEAVHVLKQGERIGEPDSFRRFTEFTMRTFAPDSDESTSTNTDQDLERRIAFHIDHRVKDTPSKVVKMLRKNVEEPASIDDSIGLKLVFETPEAIQLFLDKLHSVSAKLGSYGRLEQFSSSIDNGDDFPITNNGSSPGFEVIKAHYRVDGRVIELQCFTFTSHLNAEYRDEDAHKEYVLNRTFNSEALDLLYPRFLREEDDKGSDYSILYQKVLGDSGEWIPNYEFARRANIRLYRREVREKAPRIPQYIDKERVWEPIESRVAGILYRINNGKMEILAERKKGASNLKLPGGDYRDLDTSLIYTFTREMREEMGLDINERDVIRLNDIEVNYVPTENNPSNGVNTLIMRGFGYRINDLDFTPKPTSIEQDIESFEWVSVDYFLQNARYPSYKAGIESGWLDQVLQEEKVREAKRLRKETESQE